jgi:hypothetical protein
MRTPVRGSTEGRVNQGSPRGAGEGFRWVEWMKRIRLVFVLTTSAGVSGPESGGIMDGRGGGEDMKTDRRDKMTRG